MSEPAAISSDTRTCLTLARLQVTDFRNHGHIELNLERGAVVLTGVNGAGKTNLMEAVSLLAPGRGMRRANFADLARRDGPGGWSVAADVEGPGGKVVIGTGQNPGPADASGRAAGRRVRIDGTDQRGSGILGEQVRLLWLTPAMDRLFAGPAADRRRFLDRLVLAIDPGHGKRVLAFEKAMRERNRLLSGPGPDPAWLEAAERQMAEHGVAVTAARLDALALLGELVTDAGFESGLFPQPELALSGVLEPEFDFKSATEIEEDYAKILYDSRHKDRLAGRTGQGPHRSDLEVRHKTKDMAAQLCSTGEQKALLISILLAQTEIVKRMFDGFWPLLLFDEIGAHLDAERRHALFARIEALGIQAWMSGTDREVFRGLGASAQIFELTKAGCSPVERLKDE
jgi:DNA replication and repair protein RecF